MLATLLLAAEEAEPNKTPFYIAASLLVAFALILAFGGMAKHTTFPGSAGLQRGLMFLCALLVAATMATAVITG